MLVVLPAAGLPCGARGELVPWNSLHGPWPLRSDNHGKSVDDARWRAPSSPLRASAPTRRPTSPRLIPDHPACGVPRLLCGAAAPICKHWRWLQAAREQTARRLQTTDCGRGGPPAGGQKDEEAFGQATSLAPRSTAVSLARDSVLRHLTCRGCLSAAAEGRVASSTAQARREHRRAVPLKAGPPTSAPGRMPPRPASRAA